VNLAAIRTQVAHLAPSVRDLRIEDQGCSVYAALCTVEGKARCVQFTSAGLLGEPVLLWLPQVKTDMQLATDIAKEFRK